MFCSVLCLVYLWLSVLTGLCSPRRGRQPEQQPWWLAGQCRAHVQLRTQPRCGSIQRLESFFMSLNLVVYLVLYTSTCMYSSVMIQKLSLNQLSQWVCLLCVTALAGSLVSQVAPLELKVENQDKDDIHDEHSSDDLKSDDEGNKRDLKARGAARPRQGPSSPKYFL